MFGKRKYIRIGFLQRGILRHPLIRSLVRYGRELAFSFPVHLCFYVLKAHTVLLSFWVLLWAFVSGQLGSSLGISYLFLAPEYLNTVGKGSFFIMGMAFGGFTVAYHITCYILSAYRYTFLGLTRHPLLRFAMNNSLIPLLFLSYYFVAFIRFQLYYEENTVSEVLLKSGSFILGMFLLFSINSLYFRLTHRRFFVKLAASLDRQLKKGRLQRANVMDRLRNVQKKRAVITSYYEFPFRIRRVNNEYPYDRKFILQVFDKTQLNALIIQFIILLSLFLLGWFRELPLFQIPAAASVLILLSIALMLTGAFTYWLKEWAFSVLLMGALLWQMLPSSDFSEQPYHKAFGMRYQEQRRYTLQALQKQQNYVREDSLQTVRVLERWREHFPDSLSPKLVVIAASGGGMRSAIWTLKTLQHTDSTLGGRLMPHTALMTGSSGGLIGAAYFRELYLRHRLKGEALYAKKYLEKLGRDKLNPTVFALVVSDLLKTGRRFGQNGTSYAKDRGYALEKQLLSDTDSLLCKPLAAYREAEESALIPMLLVSPTVVNDGRKLYISPLPVSYMTGRGTKDEKVRGIEFRRFFAEQQADSLHFMTALRMNASFPYITPNVILPSRPPMAIMDAGLSDNFGIADALQFLYVFRDWIALRTSGVVLISIRDKPKERELEIDNRQGYTDQLFAPINSLAGNIFALQDIKNEAALRRARTWLQAPLDVLTFQYISAAQQQSGTPEASLSWRLTRKEKQGIIDSVHSPYNQASLKQLLKLME